MNIIIIQFVLFEIANLLFFSWFFLRFFSLSLSFLTGVCFWRYIRQCKYTVFICLCMYVFACSMVWDDCCCWFFCSAHCSVGSNSFYSNNFQLQDLRRVKRKIVVKRFPLLYSGLSIVISIASIPTECLCISGWNAMVSKLSHICYVFFLCSVCEFLSVSANRCFLIKNFFYFAVTFN